MRTHGSASELERVRMIACNMFELDKPTDEIAACLERDGQTIRKWRRVWRESGRDGLRAKAHPGRSALMDEAQRERLAAMLLSSPVEHGFDSHVWTTPLIATLIEREFGIDYHHDWVGVLLHRMGFSWQKPQRRARERDEERIAAWRREDWPEILKKTPPPMA